MTLFRLSTWRPAHLLLSWCAYWIALPVLWIAPAMPTLYRLSKPDAHGNAGLAFGDQGFKATIEVAGRIVYSHSATLTATALAIAIPPLVLWALWLRAQRRVRAEHRVGTVDEHLRERTR